MYTRTRLLCTRERKRERKSIIRRRRSLRLYEKRPLRSLALSSPFFCAYYFSSTYFFISLLARVCGYIYISRPRLLCGFSAAVARAMRPSNICYTVPAFKLDMWIYRSIKARGWERRMVLEEEAGGERERERGNRSRSRLGNYAGHVTNFSSGV